MNFQVDLAVFLVRIFELKLLWSWSRLYRKFSWTSKDLQNFISIQRAAPKIQLVLFRNIFYEIINPYLYKYKYSRHSQAYLESPYQEKFLWFYDKPFWAVPRIFFSTNRTSVSNVRTPTTIYKSNTKHRNLEVSYYQ